MYLLVQVAFRCLINCCTVYWLVSFTLLGMYPGTWHRVVRWQPRWSPCKINECIESNLTVYCIMLSNIHEKLPQLHVIWTISTLLHTSTGVCWHSFLDEHQISLHATATYRMCSSGLSTSLGNHVTFLSLTCLWVIFFNSFATFLVYTSHTYKC